MKWVNYSPELVIASSKNKEGNDCTVFAWCNTFDCTYERAHYWLRKQGFRSKGKGAKFEYVKRALRQCKKVKVKIGPYNKNNKIKIKDFCEKHPIGRYYVVVRGHALSIKDGVVYDWKYGPEREIYFAARVYLEGELR